MCGIMGVKMEMEESCGMAMMRGDTYGLAVKLAVCGSGAVDIDTVQRVQVVFRSAAGEIEKFYEDDGSGAVQWDAGAGVFLVPLSEEETFSFREAVDWQVRVLFADGSVKGTKVKTEYLYDSITDTVLGDREDDGGQEE